MSELLDRLEAISKILLIVATIVGGGWVIYEYLEKKQDARVAESIGYVRRFSTEPLIAARTRIGQAWYASRSQLQALATTPVSSSEEFARRKRQLVISVVDTAPFVTSSTTKQRGIVAEVDLIIGFFDELQVCVASGLCDWKTIDDFFAPYAKRFYCLHEPFLVWKDRSYSKGYGSALRAMFVQPGSACPS
jgi:hypothetical protein